jgi:hypothetical protein
MVPSVFRRGLPIVGFAFSKESERTCGWFHLLRAVARNADRPPLLRNDFQGAIGPASHSYAMWVRSYRENSTVERLGRTQAPLCSVFASTDVSIRSAEELGGQFDFHVGYHREVIRGAARVAIDEARPHCVRRPAKDSVKTQQRIPGWEGGMLGARRELAPQCPA